VQLFNAGRQVIGHLLETDGTNAQNTAVILPDESLLLPVLHSIPENIPSLNVTMGYPFKNSLLYNFIRSLYSLQKNRNGKGKTCLLQDCLQSFQPIHKLIDAAGC
jgi:hypothetical protein